MNSWPGRVTIQAALHTAFVEHRYILTCTDDAVRSNHIAIRVENEQQNRAGG